ncbi:fucosyltransferase [Bathycoccus prasinos]|uniref:Fucosyltransferase n=1 Tax=Bathycoccus prasinos TaxID=41875 RepID=K8ES56_9CHLO|nr:fucosyltransferase [Bathycoccus prasinos]CCO20794.1 fucosyltransferase [Bathycoccus prasinos]|eukprot:XP_007508075.1 fucosyltransferase [Bathycoccus prasinos]
MGSRLFFLGRCLTEALNSQRVVVLSNELLSTHDMLSPFKSWSNCSLKDVQSKEKKSRIRYYYPMDSISLKKTNDMPAVGALYPRAFASRGYWWWKSQEITYALRPKSPTLETLKDNFGKSIEDMIVFQVRRTDKTQGCSSIYGKKSAIRCKAEASAPKIVNYIEALDFFKRNYSTPILVVTDDAHIMEEISQLKENEYVFLHPEPAPKRIPDKDGKGGIYKHRSMKDAIDILSMSYGNPLIFTYSSGFGALALQIKQARENFCSDWSSLDWGKREWPPIGTITEGGVRGVKRNTLLVSKICRVVDLTIHSTDSDTSYCSVILKKSARKVAGAGAAIFTFCNCKI